MLRLIWAPLSLVTGLGPASDPPFSFPSANGGPKGAGGDQLPTETVHGQDYPGYTGPQPLHPGDQTLSQGWLQSGRRTWDLGAGLPEGEDAGFTHTHSVVVPLSTLCVCADVCAGGCAHTSKE